MNSPRLSVRYGTTTALAEMLILSKDSYACRSGRRQLKCLFKEIIAAGNRESIDQGYFLHGIGAGIFRLRTFIYGVIIDSETNPPNFTGPESARHTAVVYRRNICSRMYQPGYCTRNGHSCRVCNRPIPVVLFRWRTAFTGLFFPNVNKTENTGGSPRPKFISPRCRNPC